AQIALWLVDTSHDATIEAKEGTSELSKLIRHRIGLDAAGPIQLEKLRAVALRYILGNEFRRDLTCPAPASLAGVPLALGKHDDGIRDLAKRLRANYPNRYPGIADSIEAELGLSEAKLPAEALGSIDTFRFEERALLSHCAALVAEQRFEEALAVVLERGSSFWLNQDLARKAQWEACRRMAELGKVALRVASELRKTAAPPQDWIEAYSSPDGWYQLDLAQRRLEVWVSGLEDEAPERALGVVRRLYEDACHAMAEGFTGSLVGARWAIPRVLTQTHIYSDVVEPQPKPVAYFLVDAMRFEMGKELSERLPTAAEVSVRPAVVALPSITPVGMAALQPGASSSFSVVEKSGKLGALIDDAFLSDVGGRKKFAAARIPTLVDLTLDELLGLSTAKLRAKVENAQVVVVRSQEIDHAGENSSARQARRIMDEVLGDLATAVTRLAKAGIGHSVISADHGHLFASGRDDSMKIETPGGQQVDLHRRCWVGRGGTTPAGCVRVAASALGYASDLDFVFPSGCGVFKAGGDLAFHHGGPSLQELLVPVLTIRLQPAEPASASSSRVAATGMPGAITNRIFSVTLQLGGQNLSLFSSALSVRPLLLAGGKQVGVVGMADPPSALDRSTGCITLESAKPITVAFLLNDE
ncbi:MAG TPA: PglZ domain-containing protein, partial [Polyangiaceae bacterium]